MGRRTQSDGILSCKKVLINNYDNVAMDGNKIELQGYQFLVIEM